MQCDAFKLSQRPFGSWPRTQRGVWAWPIVAFTRHENGQFTARLGPLEDAAVPTVGPPKDLCLDF